MSVFLCFRIFAELAGVDNPSTLLPVDYDYLRMVLMNDHCYMNTTDVLSPRPNVKNPHSKEKDIKEKARKEPLIKKLPQRQVVVMEDSDESDGGEKERGSDYEDSEEESSEISFSEEDDEADLDFNVNDRFGIKKPSKRIRKKIAAKRARKAAALEASANELESSLQDESPQTIRDTSSSSSGRGRKKLQKKLPVRTDSVAAALVVPPKETLSPISVQPSTTITNPPPTNTKKNIIIYPSAIQGTSGMQKTKFNTMLKSAAANSNFTTSNTNSIKIISKNQTKTIIGLKHPLPQQKLTEPEDKSPPKIKIISHQVIVPGKSSINEPLQNAMETYEDSRFTEFVPLTSAKRITEQISIQTHSKPSNIAAGNNFVVNIGSQSTSSAGHNVQSLPANPLVKSIQVPVVHTSLSSMSTLNPTPTQSGPIAWKIQNTQINSKGRTPIVHKIVAPNTIPASIITLNHPNSRQSPISSSPLVLNAASEAIRTSSGQAQSLPTKVLPIPNVISTTTISSPIVAPPLSTTSIQNPIIPAPVHIPSQIETITPAPSQIFPSNSSNTLPARAANTVASTSDLDEDIWKQLEELAKCKEIQEIIDKVQHCEDSDLEDHNATTSTNPITSLNSSVVSQTGVALGQTSPSNDAISKGKFKKVVTPVIKGPERIVRGDGRVIILPAIEAPATRGAKRRLTEQPPVSPAAAPVLNSPVTKIAKLEKTPSVKDSDSRASSRRSSLAKSESSTKTPKRQSSVAGPVNSETINPDEIDSDVSWNSEDDPGQLNYLFTTFKLLTWRFSINFQIGFGVFASNRTTIDS